MTEDRRQRPDRRAGLLPRAKPGRRATDQPAAWLSISAYARAWGLTRNTVYKLLENHSLEVYRLTGAVVVTRIRNVSPDVQQREKGQET